MQVDAQASALLLTCQFQCPVYRQPLCQCAPLHCTCWFVDACADVDAQGILDQAEMDQTEIHIPCNGENVMPGIPFVVEAGMPTGMTAVVKGLLQPDNRAVLGALFITLASQDHQAAPNQQIDCCRKQNASVMHNKQERDLYCIQGVSFEHPSLPCQAIQSMRRQQWRP